MKSQNLAPVLHIGHKSVAASRLACRETRDYK